MTHTATETRQRALRLSLGVASGLALLKGTVGFWTQSLVILASAVDSLLDVVVSSMNYLSVVASESPADDRHPYGHGKIESLAGLFQSVFIAASALFLIWQSIERVLNGKPLRALGWGIATMGISMAVTLFLVVRLRRVARETGSLIMDTETLHYSSDLWTHVGVVITLFLIGWTRLVLFDPLVSFAIALFILVASAKIFYRSAHDLLDHRLPSEIETQLKDLILNHHPTLVSFHDLRTRKSGQKTFIEFHVVFKGEDSFKAVHDTTEELIAEIRKAIPNADVTAHMDTEEGP